MSKLSNYWNFHSGNSKQQRLNAALDAINGTKIKPIEEIVLTISEAVSFQTNTDKELEQRISKTANLLIRNGAKKVIVRRFGTSQILKEIIENNQP